LELGQLGRFESLTRARALGFPISLEISVSRRRFREVEAWHCVLIEGGIGGTGSDFACIFLLAQLEGMD